MNPPANASEAISFIEANKLTVEPDKDGWLIMKSIRDGSVKVKIGSHQNLLLAIIEAMQNGAENQAKMEEVLYRAETNATYSAESTCNLGEEPLESKSKLVAYLQCLAADDGELCDSARHLINRAAKAQHESTH